MRATRLHRLAKAGDLEGVRRYLDALQASRKQELDRFDEDGLTPLMHAAASPKAGVELLQLLVERGADPLLDSRSYGSDRLSVIARALQGGSPEKVRFLRDRGADLHYERAEGYYAMIDAVLGRDLVGDARLLELLQLLVESGVALGRVTSYGESALRILSRVGRFDAVKLLLDAGGPEYQLDWCPLIRAVAVGSLEDVARELATDPYLEEQDKWERTALLVAIQSGDILKAKLLLESGADLRARGQCGKPAHYYAIENRRSDMLRWLVEQGVSIGQSAGYALSPLMAAAEADNAEAVDLLLKVGVDPDEERPSGTEPAGNMKALAELFGQALGADAAELVSLVMPEQKAVASALEYTKGRDVARRLLEAGADPGRLSREARRSLLGLEPEEDPTQLDVEPTEYLRGCHRRFGTDNPEAMKEPFWEAMIRSGVNAYQANNKFGGSTSCSREPVWCAQRFGQSISLLPDGRTVQIGGEHEDWYDPDFCIYNDVFVHEPDGAIRIYGYPEALFPPTDFHTATLVGSYIYIIGSLGYREQRRYGETPVYRLDTASFRMEPLQTTGEAPGWIYEHRAKATSADEIVIFGGSIAVREGDEERIVPNEGAYLLDLKHVRWRRLRG